MEGTQTTYNGVLIDDCRTHEFTRRTIYEDGAYLYTEATLEISGLINPALNAFTIEGLAPFAQPANHIPPVLPTTTDEALRGWLMLPRRQLTYAVNSVTLLSSPAAGATVDANAGPVPQSFDIIGVNADQTLEVRFRITTFVNESNLFSNRPPWLVKNSWAMSHALDRNWYVNREIRGEAVFDLGKMPAGTAPDDYRSMLIVGPPPGWHREGLTVTPDETGTRYTYHVVDKEPRQTIVAGGVTRVSCVVTAGYEAKAGNDRDAAITLGAVDFTFGAIGSLLDTASGNLGAIPNAIRSGANNAIEFYRNYVPNRHLMVMIRIEGSLTASLQYLSEVAYAVLSSRMTAPVLNTARFSNGVEESRDYEHGVVELRAKFVSGLNGGAATAIQINPSNGNFIIPGTSFANIVMGNLGDLWNNATEDLGVAGAMVTRRRTPTAPGTSLAGSMQPPNGNGTRGYYAGVALANALANGLTTPALPVNPRNVNTAAPPLP